MGIHSKIAKAAVKKGKKALRKKSEAPIGNLGGLAQVTAAGAGAKSARDPAFIGEGLKAIAKGAGGFVAAEAFLPVQANVGDDSSTDTAFLKKWNALSKEEQDTELRRLGDDYLQKETNTKIVAVGKPEKKKKEKVEGLQTQKPKKKKENINREGLLLQLKLKAEKQKRAARSKKSKAPETRSRRQSVSSTPETPNWMGNAQQWAKDNPLATAGIAAAGIAGLTYLATKKRGRKTYKETTTDYIPFDLRN